MINGFWTLIILIAIGLPMVSHAQADGRERVNHQSIMRDEAHSGFPNQHRGQTQSPEQAHDSYPTNEQTGHYQAQTAEYVEGPYPRTYPKPRRHWGPEHTDVLQKSVIFTGYELAMMYGLTKAPESITHWEPHKRQIKNWGRNWVYNVSHPPVLDGDQIAMNFIAHPWAGAGYYQIARSSGLSPSESFEYSAIESTAIWEYGIEALIERPSIQDIIITPALGAILGEFEYRLVQKIEAQDGKVLGSKFLGRTSIVLLNPFNSIIEGTRNLFRNEKQMRVFANFRVTPEFLPSSSERHVVKKGNKFLFLFHIDM